MCRKKELKLALAIRSTLNAIKALLLSAKLSWSAVSSRHSVCIPLQSHVQCNDIIDGNKVNLCSSCSRFLMTGVTAENACKIFPGSIWVYNLSENSCEFLELVVKPTDPKPNLHRKAYFK